MYVHGMILAHSSSVILTPVDLVYLHCCTSKEYVRAKNYPIRVQVKSFVRL
jgi:hypothetical protein